jgi:predicted transcriptional regulator
MVDGRRTLDFPSDDEQRAAVRSLSRTLFGGAQYRIEVGAAIAASDGIVCLIDLVEILGDPPGKSSVNTELKVLERAGLLTRVRTPRDDRRRVYLFRQPSQYWSACLELARAPARVSVSPDSPRVS